MNKGHSGMMFIIFLLLGILINLQFRGIILSEPNEQITIKNLAAELEAERKENKKLIEQLASIEAEREQLWKNLGNNLNNQEINTLLRKRDYENFRAGLTAVKGSGIVITMEDAPAKGELDIEDYIIHDNDINSILDELKANGAQAISINGERVVFSTKPVCAGPTIIVNNNRYPPPYVIKAIGDPDMLYEAIETMAQVAFMRLANIRINVAKQDDIVINKYNIYTSLEESLKGLEVVSK
jgi:uncharacterized protein YlxW (UPF0749 family)